MPAGSIHSPFYCARCDGVILYVIIQFKILWQDYCGRQCTFNPQSIEICGLHGSVLFFLKKGGPFVARNSKRHSSDGWLTKADGTALNNPLIIHALICEIWFFFSLSLSSYPSSPALPIFPFRIVIYLIQMTGEIEVHEPLHSHNTGHVSEQCRGNSAEKYSI